MSAPKGINWDEQPLGEISDAKLAEKLGVTRAIVYRQRTQRQIPSDKSKSKVLPGTHSKINWSAQPLGQVTDTAIAAAVGCSREYVRLMRNARGIPVYKKTIPEGLEELLGTCPDSSLVQQFDVTITDIRHWRKERDIPIFSKVDWNSVPYGTATDAALAKRYGVALGTMQGHRWRRGIPPYRTRSRRHPEIDWDEQPLGIESDMEISRRLNISVSSVCRERKKRGIPAAARRTFFGKAPIVADWDALPLGQVADTKIAEQVGCSIQTVRRQRTRRGIPTSRSRGPAKGWDNEPLGKISDSMLALMLGCSVGAVTQARAKRGIPPYKQKKQKWK